MDERGQPRGDERESLASDITLNSPCAEKPSTHDGVGGCPQCASGCRRSSVSIDRCSRLLCGEDAHARRRTLLNERSDVEESSRAKKTVTSAKPRREGRERERNRDGDGDGGGSERGDGESGEKETGREWTARAR